MKLDLETIDSRDKRARCIVGLEVWDIQEYVPRYNALLAKFESSDLNGAIGQSLMD